MIVCYCSSCNQCMIIAVVVSTDLSSLQVHVHSTNRRSSGSHSRFQAGTHRKASQRWNKTASSSEQHSVEYTQPHSDSVHVVRSLRWRLIRLLGRREHSSLTAIMKNSPSRINGNNTKNCYYMTR